MFRLSIGFGREQKKQQDNVVDDTKADIISPNVHCCEHECCHHHHNNDHRHHQHNFECSFGHRKAKKPSKEVYRKEWMNGAASLSISRPRKTIALPVDSQQTQSKLFSVPAEIRDYIYKLVLEINDDPVRMETIPKNHLSILQACRRILLEAETIFYAAHRFQYSGQQSHLHRIGPPRRDAITAITIVTSSGAIAFGMIQGLHRFPNLKSLHIQREVSVRYLNISDWAIMRRQIRSELDRFKHLSEVRILMPLPTSELTQAEMPRAEKLASIDADLVRSSQSA